MHVLAISSLIALALVSLVDAQNNNLRGNPHAAAQLEARVGLSSLHSAPLESFAEKKAAFLTKFDTERMNGPFSSAGIKPKMEAHAKQGEGSDRLTKLANAGSAYFGAKYNAQQAKKHKKH